MHKFQFDTNKVIAFYDELSALLTRFENSEISEMELYVFMTDLHSDIADLIN